ncbi:ABC transporter substrate-binding protein [Caldalkalibacillus mannanilyticus]|uniref:ABC transporter substrate-binding protein n=1 Tax=Caldalkalibacillus mannanilyticus TaxID=1418 RepID=UPI000469FCF5|nr:extracellular solute-binding protein [Caldalkalibacillus mannanilyticus]
MSEVFRKLLIILLVVVLPLSLLSACGSKSTGQNGHVKLELFSNKSESIETLKSMIQKFEEQNPTIKIELNAPPEAETVLKTRLTKNDIPDLMAIGGNYTFGELARAGVFHDFSGDSNVNKVHEAYMDMLKNLVGSEKEGIFGIPYAANANGVIYNIEKLEALGLQPPTTWDEFIHALEVAKEAGETPIYFTLLDAWTGMVTWNSLAANLQGDDFAQKRSSGEVTFQDRYSEVADKFLTLLNYGQHDRFGVGYGDGNNAFARGESLFYLQGVWAIPEITKANPDIKLGVFPFPVTNQSAQNRLVSGVDVLLSMGAKTKYPEEAKKFIDFMLQEEIAKQYITEQSAFSAVQGVFQDDPIMVGFKTSFETGNITSFPDHYYPPGMQVANLVHEFLLEGKNKEAFLDRLDQEWDKVEQR